MDKDTVSIWFHNPVSGIDIEDGSIFLSNRHKVKANWAQQDGIQTKFINDEGEIVAQWSTVDVSHIEWPAGNKVIPTEKAFQTRMAEIKKEFANAWSKWSDPEVAQLQTEFNEYRNIEYLCNSHKRAPGGITSKLKALGLISEDFTRDEAIEFVNKRSANKSAN